MSAVFAARDRRKDRNRRDEKEKELKKLRVQALRNMCTDADLSTEGTKPALIKRLLAASAPSPDHKEDGEDEEEGKATASGKPKTGTLCAAELQRLENIARNRAHLAKLGLGKSNTRLTPKKQGTKRKRRSKQSPGAPS